MTIYLFQKRAVKWLCYPLLLILGGCPDAIITRPKEDKVDSVSLFAQHLKPLIKKYKCSNCHMPDVGEDTPSDFAVDDDKVAHKELLDRGNANLDNPSNSGIVTKVGGGHNCPAGTPCNVVANSFILAIKKWRDGLGDARAKVIKTEWCDITDVTVGEKNFYYDLSGLIENPAMSPATSPTSPTRQRGFTGRGTCTNCNIGDICLEVTVHKNSGNTVYFIDKFEIKTKEELYVKNIATLLNGRAINNFSSSDCAVQPTEGYNFSPNTTQVQIKDNDARQHRLAFRFKQLRPATESDNVCKGQEKPAEVELTGPMLFRNYCTASCHSITTPGPPLDINNRTHRNNSLEEIRAGDMPQRGARQIQTNEERVCLIDYLSNPSPDPCD